MTKERKLRGAYRAVRDDVGLWDPDLPDMETALRLALEATSAYNDDAL